MQPMLFGLKVTAYTVIEIQKTYEATGRGGLVVWFVFLFGGVFFNHTLDCLVLIQMLKGIAAPLQ